MSDNDPKHALERWASEGQRALDCEVADELERVAMALRVRAAHVTEYSGSALPVRCYGVMFVRTDESWRVTIGTSEALIERELRDRAQRRRAR